MSKRKPSNQIDSKLLARYLSSEYSPVEKEKVEKWRKGNIRNKQLLEILEIVWNKKRKPPKKSDVNRDWVKVAERAGLLQKGKNPEMAKRVAARKKSGKNRFIFLKNYKRKFTYAAIAFIICLSLPFIGKLINNTSSKDQDQQMKEIMVKKGKQKKLVLGDGTQVILDAGTFFRYPLIFKKEIRQVYLSGEGYFKVAEDKKKPFEIWANHAIITVLGTRFNVRAWNHTRKVEVAVAEGQVSLCSKKVGVPGKTVHISRGEVSILPENGYASLPRKGDIDNQLGWINRDRIFDNVRLLDLLYQLERWYDIRFIFDKDIPVSDHLTLHLQDKPLKIILRLIVDLTGLEYRQEGKTVYLFSKKDRKGNL